MINNLFGKIALERKSFSDPHQGDADPQHWLCVQFTFLVLCRMVWACTWTRVRVRPAVRWRRHFTCAPALPFSPGQTRPGSTHFYFFKTVLLSKQGTVNIHFYREKLEFCTLSTPVELPRPPLCNWWIVTFLVWNGLKNCVLFRCTSRYYLFRFYFLCWNYQLSIVTGTGSQCFGSVFIWYGSGSIILGWILVRFRPGQTQPGSQHLYIEKIL